MKVKFRNFHIVCNELVLMNFYGNWSARKSSYKLVKRHASPKYDVVQSSFFFFSKNVSDEFTHGLFIEKWLHREVVAYLLTTTIFISDLFDARIDKFVLRQSITIKKLVDA